MYGIFAMPVHFPHHPSAGIHCPLIYEYISEKGSREEIEKKGKKNKAGD